MLRTLKWWICHCSDFVNKASDLGWYDTIDETDVDEGVLANPSGKFKYTAKKPKRSRKGLRTEIIE